MYHLSSPIGACNTGTNHVLLRFFPSVNKGTAKSIGLACYITDSLENPVRI